MQTNARAPRCALCRTRHCYQGKDCFDRRDEFTSLFDEETLRLARAAAAIEGAHYGKASRLEETILFAQRLGCTRVGLAYCIGLAEEARFIADALSLHFDVLSVCCKVGGLDKRQLGMDSIRDDRVESTCNPAAQARLLDEHGAELLILCGLCVGHDAIFTRHAQAPVTTLIAKDRLLAHNPAGAVYCRYVARRPDAPVKTVAE